MRLHLLTFVLVLTFISTPAPAWEGSADNKSPGDFASNEDIAFEAKELCVKSVRWNTFVSTEAIRKGREARRYFSILLQAARDKNGGTIPPWLYVMREGAEGTSTDACLQAFRSAVPQSAPQESTPPESIPAGTQTTETAPEKKPKQ
jgi:hypothetical protein